jgi:tetratricopeptide (TPR) repeat protein
MRRSGHALHAALKAHREQRWDDAAPLWRVYIASVPSDVRAQFHLGNALVAQAKFSEALALAEAMRARFPRNPEGPILAARISSRDAGPKERVVAWRAIAVRFPSNATALEEVGRGLADAGAHKEANAIATLLQAIDDLAGTRLKGRILSVQQPFADRSEFWRAASQRFPKDIDFRRKALDARLRTGSLDAARDFEALRAAGALRAADVNFAIGLANLHRGDRATLKKVVRAYLDSLRQDPGRRNAALKLSRMIFAEFPYMPPDPAKVQPRFEKMVRAAPASDGPKTWLLRTCDVYTRVKRAVPDSLLETDVSRAQCEAFVSLARARLSAAAPFSLVRLGDAEANAFEYEPALARFYDADAAERERSWWGRELDGQARADMARRVSEAAWSASALGIPCAGRVLRDLDLKDEEVLNAGRSGRGIRTVIRAVGERLASGAALPTFVSFAIHQDLHKRDLYPSLLGGARDVVCVSSHASLPDVLRARFGVVSATNITLRSAFSLRDRVEQAEEAFDLPEQCDAVVAMLDSDLQGRLVIVAAGYLGKWIAHQAMLRGAVALDLGSVPDYWMGKRTRGYLDV